MVGFIPKRMKIRRREETMAEESGASPAAVGDHIDMGSNPLESTNIIMKVMNSSVNHESTYNQLEDEAKQVFLLCGVHGPSVLVIDLLKYVIGLGVFKHVTSIVDARSKLHKIIVDLEKSSLLLQYSAREVKLSPLLCRMASGLASRNHNAFSSLKDCPSSCTQIILKRCNIQKLPEMLNCPNLYFLYLDSNDNPTLKIPLHFFERMGNLQVLVLIGMDKLSLPASLVSLANLKTLCLNQCCLQDLVGIGALKSLEILSFFLSSMKEFPSEIRQLTHLRMLDVSYSKIEVIPPKIISNLTKLEELYMGLMETEHDILAELTDLRSLTALELQIPEIYVLPCSKIFENLKRYNIVIGDKWEWSDSNETSKLLKLKLDRNTHLEKEIKAMVEGAEDLYLEIYDLEEIFPDPLAVDQISEKLKVIKAKSCDRIEYLLSVSKVNKFSQLVEIEVSKCRSMKDIVLMDSGTTIDEIESIPVRSLTLQDLPAINSFCSNDSESLDIPTLFPNEKDLFRPLKHLKLIKISRIMLLVITTPSNGMVPLQNLQTMEIRECDDLQYLFVIEGFNMHQNCGGLLPHLCQLRLCKLDQLRSIVGLNHPGRTLSFKMLKHLTVCHCNRLRYLLPLYVLPENLQQLEYIEIRDCEMLELVFGDNDEDKKRRESNETTTTNSPDKLPKVKSLILEKLPKFSGCCPYGRSVEWLSLKTVSVVKCDKIQQSSLGMIDKRLLKSVEVNEWNERAQNEDPEINIAYLFELTGQLPRMEEVTIKDSEELKKYMEYLPLSFKQLKTVKASQCDNELNKFLSILLNQSSKLEHLKVENCELLEQVFDLKEFVAVGQNLKFPNLNTMQLHGLPNLTCIWNKDPRETVELGKLVKLEITECGLSKGPLSSTLLQKLALLEELKIESCKMLEQVVEEDTKEKQERSFPNLKNLQLANLPMLIKFNTGNYHFEFPNLQSLRIENCPVLNAFTTGFLSKATNEGTSNHVPSDAKMGACSKLQTLKLVGHETFKEIWEGGVSNIPECKLKEVEVDSFSNLRYIFPSSMLPKLSEKLEKLVVRNCSSLINLFQRENDSIKGFRYLKSIVLENLPMLSSFSVDISEFPNLERVRIVKCPGIETFSRNVSAKANNFRDTDSSESRPFRHGKTSLLPQLEELELSDLPNMKLWNQEPQITVFENLTSLKIIGCGSIEKLFSVSMAQYLSSLKLLTLYKCKNMVHVLHHRGRKIPDPLLVFQNLETLVLKHLPELTSFCEDDVNFEKLPVLKMVRVEGVPKMTTFVKNTLRTPQLKQVHVTFIRKCWLGNLNSTITFLNENHNKLKEEFWESDQISAEHHTDAAESSSQIPAQEDQITHPEP